eukprot:gene1718-1823_t
MSSVGDYCRLNLRVKCPTQRGQAVGVQGFGLTHGEDAIKLVTTPEAHPIWFTANPIVIPRSELVNYKYCIIEDGAVKVTEPMPNNPRLLIPEEEDVTLEDEFNLDFLQTVRNRLISEAELEVSAKRLPPSEPEKNAWKQLGGGSSKLFIVCYHLPIVIKRTNRPHEPFEATWAESLIARSTSGSISSTIKTIWIGTISVRDLTPDEKPFVIALLRTLDCIPVFLDDDVATAAYQGFCKTIMWPVFHNVDPLDQIHAAWNLPPTSSSSLASTLGLTSDQAQALSEPSSYRGSPNPTPSPAAQDSPKSGNNSRKQRSLSSLEAESKVLEWNKKEEEYFECYRQVNQIFATTLLELLHDNDVVWVHDYHLMLVPGLVRPVLSSEKSSLRNVKIIFFLHIPFPTSQIFRTLPESVQLLQAMVSADLVGFHAFDHARHFLNATRRTLGFRSHTRQGGMLTVSVKDREVIVTMSHVSVETDRLDIALASAETKALAEEYAKKYAGRKIIVGIDVCQRLSGLALKLFAMEKLLSEYNLAEKGGIVLIQRGIRQGSRLEDEETTSADVHKLVNSLNQKYGNKFAAATPSANGDGVISSSAPIVIDYAETTNFKGISLNERLALYLVADIFLLTCIREGLNLLPLEYIYARRELPRGGVVVTSEFSTCATLLNGALKVNPFSPSHVSDAILQALSMSAKDCDYRRQRDLPFIVSHPSSLWTKHILNELEQLRAQVGHGRTTPRKYPALLAQNNIVIAYENAAREVGITPMGTRVFVFDYGGTLLTKEKFDIYLKQSLSAISGRRPPESTMAMLKKLSEDPLNIVIVVTGLTRTKLGNIFQDLKNVTIATSNGLVFSLGENLQALAKRGTGSPGVVQTGTTAHLTPVPSSVLLTPLVAPGVGSTSVSASNSAKIATVTSSSSLAPPVRHIETADGRSWEYINGNIDWDAVNGIATPIITRFTFRTNGTCQSLRFPGVGWSYFGADPEWGTKQATQLTVELEAALANHDVTVTTLIPGSIEVVPRTLKKGNVVSILLDRVVACRGGRLPAMVTVIGDEEVDDGMFEAVYDHIAKSPPSAQLRRMKTFAITVGKRYSPANYYVNDVADVEAILQLLTHSN